MTPKPSKFSELTKRDLAGFDQAAITLILSAIEIGCTGRVSNKGHCILRNNNGDTTAVPRSLTSANRTAQNARAQVKRLLSAHHTLPADAPAERTPAAPQVLTVSQALTQHGAAFSRWLDTQIDGLPAEAQIEVTFDIDDQLQFTRVADNTSTSTPSPAPAEEVTVATTHAAAADAPDPTTILERVRNALGEDPRIAELTAEVERLRQELADETDRADTATTRADEAEARIQILRDSVNQVFSA